MVAIRIPGPEDIPSVGVARDPGIRATPAAFGLDVAQAQVGVAQTHAQEAAALQKVGEAAIHVGAFLDRKRTAASAALAGPVTMGQFQQEADEAVKKRANAGVPTSAWDHGNAVRDDLNPIIENLHAKAVRDFGLDDLHAAQLKGKLLSQQNAYINQGVHWAGTILANDMENKGKVAVTGISERTASSGADISEGINAVNPVVDSLRGVVSPEKIEPFRLAAHKQVIDTKLATLEAQSKDEKLSPEVRAAAAEEAQVVRERGYGRIPQPGLVQRPLPAATHSVIDRVAREFPQFSPELIKAYVGIESSGNPNLQKGKYKGLLQLSDGTVDPREDEFHKYGGVNVWDPEQNLRAGLKKLTVEAQGFRAQFGRDPTPTDIYLLHQQGVAGYPAHLRNPNAPAWQSMFSTREGQEKGPRWARDAIWGNIADQDKHLFPGGVDSVTSQQFLDYWRMKIEGGGGPTGPGVAQPLVPDMGKSIEWHQKISNSQTVLQTKESQTRFDNFQSQIIDAKIGGPLPSLDAIKGDPFLSDAHKNSLTSQLIPVVQEQLELQRQQQRFNDPNAGPYDRFSKNDQTAIDNISQSMVQSGMKPNEAIQRSIERSDMVPKWAAAHIRSELFSNDPARVAAASVIASTILGRNENAFVGDPGANEIRKLATDFKQFTQKYGWNAQRAAQEMIKEQQPEFQSEIAARIKGQNIDEIVKKQLAPTDITNQFGWPIIGRPNLEFGERAQVQAYQDYVDLFKRHYESGKSGGDVDRAKKDALADLRDLWGPTYINGSFRGNVMRYPPEQAPAHRDIPNISREIADQALADIRGLPGGKNVGRAELMIVPKENGATAAAYMHPGIPSADGKTVSYPPVPYTLLYIDNKGHPQVVQKDFVFNPGVVSEQRETALAKEKARVDALRAAAQERVTGAAHLTSIRPAGAAPLPLDIPEPPKPRGVQGPSLYPEPEGGGVTLGGPLGAP